MAVEPLSLRSLEDQTRDSYEAVMVMAQRARQIMQDRLIKESFKEIEVDEIGVFDEFPVRDPEDYEEQEKATTEAMNEFLDGKLKWSRPEEFSD